MCAPNLPDTKKPSDDGLVPRPQGGGQYYGQQQCLAHRGASPLGTTRPAFRPEDAELLCEAALVAFVTPAFADFYFVQDVTTNKCTVAAQRFLPDL
jgi:hypothetical protein